MAIRIQSREALNYNAPDPVTGQARRDQYLDFIDDSGDTIYTMFAPADGGTATLAAGGVKVWRGLLSQVSTDVPTAVVIENTLGGDIVWGRLAPGGYYGTLIGAFPNGKTFLSIGSVVVIGPVFGMSNVNRANDDQIDVTTIDTSTGDGYDAELDQTPLEILVYPV